MSLMCAYQDCLCAKYPCSKIAFFRLPTDGRRSTWIKNSGNKSLINIGAKANRFFCESHFRDCDIRTQFNRKLLRKHAVPIEHRSCVRAVESECNQTQHCSILNKHNGEEINGQTGVNFVIEHLDDSPNTTDLYEDMEMPEFEGQDSNNTNEEQLQNSYNLLDFYIPGNSDEPAQSEEQSFTQDSTEDDTTETYYFETSNNQVDSSTLDMHSDEDVDKSVDELEVETGTIMSNDVALLEPATTENVQVTTSNNSYEEDKHFALSLVGYFQRLPKLKKNVAKLKILQYLTELEIGLPANL